MSGAPEPVIAVVIPARNEADVIGRAVASLLRQSGCDLHIFVVDDNSTDGTAEAARTVTTSGGVSAPSVSPSSGERVGEDTDSNRVTVISGAPLPSGWSGKLWAVQQGVQHALQLNPDFLLLTDADIEHAPDNIAQLVSIAEAGDYDLASFMVKLHCRSFAERLLIPAFVFFFFMLYPPQWVRDRPRLAPNRRARTWGTNIAGAAGGCMLVRPAALERIGGIAAIRQEIIDDCALARAIEGSGGKVWLGVEGVVSGHDFRRAERTLHTTLSGLQPASETRSLRPYDSFAEIERMIARTAFNQLHHSLWLLLGTVVGMLLLYVLPIALIVSGRPVLTFAGAFAYGLMAFIYLPMVRYYRLNPLWALTLPLAGVFYTAATVHSAVKYLTGHGGQWKGRAQDLT